MAVDPAGIVALASGVPLVVLGVALFFVRPPRRDVLAFAGFSALWGCQIVLANLGRVLYSAEVHAVAFPTSLALWPPAYVLLVYHVNVLRGGRARHGPLWTATGLALAGLLALVVNPAWMVSVAQQDGTVVTQFGPAWAPFFFVPFYGAFSFALVVLYQRYRSAAPGTPRRAARGHLAALALFSAYSTVRLTAVYLQPPLSIQFAGATQQAMLVATVLVGAVIVFVIVGHLMRRPVRLEAIDLPLLAAFIVPAGVAFLEIVLERQGVIVDTVGVWRLLMVVALVYALARNALFDLDLRLMRLAPPSLAGLGFGLGLAFGLLAWVSPGAERWAPVSILVGLGAAAAVVLLRKPITRALFPGVVDDEHYRHQRALDVYLGHLEQAILHGPALGSMTLRRLRQQLGVHVREHHALVAITQRQLAAHGTPPRGGLPDAFDSSANSSGSGVAHLPAAGPRVRVGPGSVVGNQFRVDRLLGEGAHGRAFLAHDLADDLAVVVKVVSTQHLGGSAATALLREARLLQRVQHPNVVAIIDVVDGADEALLVLEYAEGGSLQGLLDRQSHLVPARALRIIGQALAGLEAAHEKGIVHRDVKPDNVLLTRDERAMVADFGVAREIGPEATNVSGAAIGTLLYMSPEQVRGHKADARSDVYAVGAMLHVALTGRFYLPLTGQDDFQLRRAIIEKSPALDHKLLPARVVPILRKALEKNPERRYATAAAFRRALSRAEPTRPGA